MLTDSLNDWIKKQGSGHAGNQGAVVNALLPMVRSDKEGLSQEAALLAAYVVGKGKDEAIRKRADARAKFVLEEMILTEHRSAEARKALIQLRVVPDAPRMQKALSELQP